MIGHNIFLENPCPSDNQCRGHNVYLVFLVTLFGVLITLFGVFRYVVGKLHYIQYW